MRTSDVYLSAALLSLGYELVRVNRDDPRHMIFEFEVPELKEGEIVLDNMASIETQWANRKLEGNLFDFAEAIKRMKSVIHSS